MSISPGLSLQAVPTAKTDAPAMHGVVLLVDDEPQLTRALARHLVAAGYEVETANDGTEAVARLKERFFDVVISDISMPGMNGLELLRAIREKDLDVPVIVMTGAPAVQSAIEAIEHGALRYLIKPV